jgi:hypothetical protein
MQAAEPSLERLQHVFTGRHDVEFRLVGFVTCQ